MTQQRKKKAIEYHFVDMNDPDRYKKLKVARACDFCRRRKSKCDVGIPGSGTCSNCKKANHICIFSPVNPITSPVTKVSKKRQSPQQQKKHTSLSPTSSQSTTLSITATFTDSYQEKYSLFSMDERARCGYERDNIYAHVTLSSTPVLNKDIPVYSKELEQELFEVYFTHVHPFFPILDKYFTLQSLRFDNQSLPNSLKWAVMAIVIARFSNQQQQKNSTAIANLYHKQAIDQLDHSTPCLLTVQTLFLLYKYQEMMTPVGTPVSSTTIGYLKEIQSILVGLENTQQGEDGSLSDEFVCRSSWVLFIILTMSNNSDKRLKELDCCSTPNRLPLLTETEHYDKIELNTTCNLINLINIALLYSQTISYISNHGTLFSSNQQQVEEFNKLSNGLAVWKSTLPSHLSVALSNSVLQQQGDKNMPSSFTNYLCFIHDVLQLLISIHQPTQLHTISKNAFSVCIRAYNFTVGDTQFTRLASIQGSRLVSFGLTLALQSFSFEQPIEYPQFYSSCSLSFQVFEHISLSPQLYMTIQSYHNQVESKKKLQQHESQQQKTFLTHQQSSNSSLLTMGGLDSSSSSNSSSSNFSNQTTPSSSSSNNTSYYFSNNQSKDNNNNNRHQPYNNYHSTNYYQENKWNYNNYSQQQQQENLNDGMPATPTLEPEIDMISPLIAMDSYFQPQQENNHLGTSVMVSTCPFDFINSHSIETLYDTKSCCNNNSKFV